MELVGSAVPVDTPNRYITSFYQQSNYDIEPVVSCWLSEAESIFKPNLIGPELGQEIALDFKFNKTHATITVQFTEDKVISANGNWQDIISFGVFPSDESLTKIIPYPLYTRSTSWVRIKVVQQGYNGRDATFDIAKINGDEYTIKIRNKGKEYKTGETYIINGRLIGGEIDDSPNGAFSIYIDSANANGEIITFDPILGKEISFGAAIELSVVSKYLLYN
jgi:hypothetical protein